MAFLMGLGRFNGGDPQDARENKGGRRSRSRRRSMKRIRSKRKSKRRKGLVTGASGGKG